MKAFFYTPAVATVLLSVIIFVVWGCARKSGEPVMFTGKTFDQVEMRTETKEFCLLGKTQYAQVSREWVLWCYQDYRAWMSEGPFGVVKWDDRSQCTFFATAFEVYAQRRYFAQAFHNRIPAPGIAVGTIWYVSSPNLGHAVNVIVTERGREFFEPQTGKFFSLTDSQVASMYQFKFD